MTDERTDLDPHLAEHAATVAAVVDVTDLMIFPPQHLTTVEQEAELLAILRVVAPPDRADGWHVGYDGEGCDRRAEAEWRSDMAHEAAYEELSASRPALPTSTHPRRRRDQPPDPEADAAWEAFAATLREHTAQVGARAAEIAPTLTFPGDDLCETGCPYPRARALLRAIEAG